MRRSTTLNETSSQEISTGWGLFAPNASPYRPRGCICNGGRRYAWYLNERTPLSGQIFQLLRRDLRAVGAFRKPPKRPCGCSSNPFIGAGWRGLVRACGKGVERVFPYWKVPEYVLLSVRYPHPQYYPASPSRLLILVKGAGRKPSNSAIHTIAYRKHVKYYDIISQNAAKMISWACNRNVFGQINSHARALLSRANDPVNMSEPQAQSPGILAKAMCCCNCALGTSLISCGPLCNQVNAGLNGTPSANWEINFHWRREEADATLSSPDPK